MPLAAASFYLQSKYEHEIVRDIYVTDMLRFAAFGMIKEEDRPPRYWDMVKPQKMHGAAQAAPQEYSDDDVVDMFRGEGKLV